MATEASILHLRAPHLERRVDELSSVERSRKRKLRELYAVASHSESPIPSFVNLDAPDSQAPEGERRFLEGNDVKKGGFHENTIPQRRNLRSAGTKRSATPTKGEDRATANQNRLNALLSAQRDNRESLQERTKGDASYNFGIPFGSPSKAQRSDDAPGVKESQAEILRASPGRVLEPTKVLDELVDQTMNDVVETANVAKLPDEPEVPLNALEKENIVNNVEATPELSEGVDPNIAIPRSAEDVANLPGPVLNGDGDPNHVPAVVHLPSQEEQEQRLREQDERAEQKKRDEQTKENTDANGKLTLQVPNLEAQTNGHHDGVSSPGSSEAPLSATTANNHESADTSPDNEAHRYEADAMDVDKPTQSSQEDPKTPPELAPTEEEIREKEQHDSRLKAQLELVRERILESSPVSADAQLLQEQAVAESASATPKAASTEPRETDGLNAEARELRGGTENAQQMMEDEQEDHDEVVGVPTPAEKAAGEPALSLDNEKPVEDCAPRTVGDSADAMVVDKPEMPKESSPQETEQSKATSESIPAAESQKQASTPKEAESVTEAPTQATPASTPSAAPATPTIERMTTRVASGALKHKSVSEILGETPRQTPDKSRSGTSTPGSPAAKLRLKELAKEKERSKLSTVVFAKQPKMPLQNNGNGKPAMSGTVADKVIGVDYPDYLMPVIQAQAYNKVRGFQSLEAMIASAHKTISTSNSAIPLQEAQAQKIISKIHALQSQDKWSLRQPKRAAEPNRPATHWDELLKEAKWMRTDFREERKWKMAFASKVAHTCAMWVEGDAEERKLLERKIAKPRSKDEHMEDADSEIPHPTPDLMASSDNETPVDEFDDEPSISHLDAVAPTAIFSLDNDDLVFAMNRSPTSDKLLQELPIYGQPLQVHRTELPNSAFDPDASWKKPYLPISKFIEGKIILKDDAPPRKKSRYEYEYESEDEDGVVFGQADRKSKELPADQIEVALFNPENRHLRERIHAGHQFRPPSEFPMPSQTFFENRYSSQWTWAEDDELKQLVREYQYNWSLISSMLASKSVYSSAAERRTPWECFERWINLEGLPADMVKTHYFRAYNNRIDAARRSILHQATLQAAAPAPAPGSVAAPVLRQGRRTTDSQRVERRRNSKHLNLIDAMRKVAKKRESALQKQQHAQNQANMRKQPEAAPQNMPKHTPQQISKLKHDRELQLQERLQRTIAQQDQARRNQAAAIRNPQNPQGWPIGPNGLPQQPRNMQGVPQTPGMGGVGRPNNLAVPVPNHLPHVPMQSMQPNTGQTGQMGMPGQNAPKMHPGMGQMPINGMPAAQMQGMQGMQGLQAQHNRLAVPNSANSPDINLVMQAQRISQQQRAAVQMQNGQHAGQTGAQMHQSPPNNMRPMPNMGAGGQFIHSQTNPQSLAAQQAMHNFTNSPSNPQPPPNAQQHHGVGASGLGGAAGSPRPAAQMAQIEAGYRAKYPTATPDQIRKLVSDAVMLQQRQQLQQGAMHAAAGNGAGGGAGNNGTAAGAGGLNGMGTPSHGNGGMGMGGQGQMNTQPQQPLGTPMQGNGGLSAGMQNSPVQYAQMLRAQQERQAANVAAAAAQAQAQAQAQGAAGVQNGVNGSGGLQGGGQVGQGGQRQSQSPAGMGRGGVGQQGGVGVGGMQNHTPKMGNKQMSPPQAQVGQNLGQQGLGQQGQRMTPLGGQALQQQQQQQQQHHQQHVQAQANQAAQNSLASLNAQQAAQQQQQQMGGGGGGQQLQQQQQQAAQQQQQQQQRSASAQSAGK